MSKNHKPTAADKASRYTGRMVASQGASVAETFQSAKTPPHRVQRQATYRYPHGAEDEGRRRTHNYERPFAQGPGTHLRLPLRPLPVKDETPRHDLGAVLAGGGGLGL